VSKLDVADVAALACELLHVAPADLVDILDVEGVAGILASPAASATVPHEAAAGLLHGFLGQPPVPHLERQLALLVAVHFLARAGLDIDLEPAEETRKHIHDIAIGAATLERTIAWLDPRVTAQGQEGEMFERFSTGARHVLVTAGEEARLLDHGAVGAEHLLLGLLHGQEGRAAGALGAAGISLEVARSKVAALSTTADPLTPGSLPFTAAAKKTLELSLREALQRGHPAIDTGHLLLGLMREGTAGPVLEALGVDLVGLREAIMLTPEEDLPAALEGGESPADEEVLTGYLDRIASYRLLTHEDHLGLAQTIEAGQSAHEELERPNSDLSAADREELRSRWNKGEEARRTLLESQFHVSFAIARKYRSSGVPLIELIEAANEGLARAVERFDWRKGLQLSTYATWWIRAAVTRLIIDSGRSKTAE